MAAEVLRTIGVRKSYEIGTEVEVEVLHGINITLHSGEMAALTGPSGSGKSTLLNLIGLLEKPTAGIIQINGEEAQNLDEAGLTRLRGASLGFVFQFHHLLPAFTAVENVLMPLLIRDGRFTRSMREEATELLVRVGLENHLDKKPRKLSGGQQQRVALARALILNPPLVLADEPTGNLDTATAHEMFTLLRELNLSRKITFLIVTHDTRLANLCDRTIELIDGCIVGDRQCGGPAT